MRVLVLGATGYLGGSAASAFRRAGHDVWGLTRSEEKADSLRRREIRPVVGDVREAESWAAVAAECSVVVHASVDYSTDVAEVDRGILAAMGEIADEGNWPKTLIYTSGVWVHGDNPRKVDESTPLDPTQGVLWRPDIEEEVLEAESFLGMVLRPGLVYGHSGGLTGILFDGAVRGRMQVPGDGTNHWAMVHADDVGAAYVLAAESGLDGEIFDIVDSSRATVAEMAAAAAQAAGFSGAPDFLPVSEAAALYGGVAEALAANQIIDGSKARRLLGWEPRHEGFLDAVDAYFEAWKAHRG